MDGLLLIDKPRGMTSHDVVACARRSIAMKAIGHAGTLDPFATGLLILCLGHATRLSEYLIGEDKTYTGTIKLGERTTTDDVDGEMVEHRPVMVTPTDIERVRLLFSGTITQVPPQYSAVQLGGKRAYKLARQGTVVDLPARMVHILELELALCDSGLSVGSPLGQPTADRNTTGNPPPVVLLDLRVTCSAGTYIRALARDIGEALGCGAHLTMLRRVRSGFFTLADAVTLDVLQRAATENNWQRHVLPMDRAVQQFPECRLDAQAAQRMLLGQAASMLNMTPPTAAGLCRVYDPVNHLIAIGDYDLATAVVKPVKVFRN